MPAPDDDQEKETAVRIDATIARELKIIAAQEGTTIKKLLEHAARSVIQERIARRQPKSGSSPSRKPRRG